MTTNRAANLLALELLFFLGPCWIVTILLPSIPNNLTFINKIFQPTDMSNNTEIKTTKPKWRAEIAPDLEIWAKDGAAAMNLSPTVFLNDSLRSLIGKGEMDPSLGRTFAQQRDLVQLRVLERGLTRISVLSEAITKAAKRYHKIENNADLADEIKVSAKLHYEEVVAFIKLKAGEWAEGEKGATIHDASPQTSKETNT